MNSKHSRGPPQQWDFPEPVYRIVELCVATCLAGLLLYGSVSAIGLFTDSSFLTPPSYEKALAVLDRDRDNSPILARVRL